MVVPSVGGEARGRASSAGRENVGGDGYPTVMTQMALDYIEIFGPGILATVIAALAVWVLRGVLVAVGRAVLWIVVEISRSIINAIKWRIGW